MNEGGPVTGKTTVGRKRWIALIVGAVALVIVMLQGIRSSSQKAHVPLDEEMQHAAPRFALQNTQERPALAPAVAPGPKESNSLVAGKEGKNLLEKEVPRSYQGALRRQQLRRLEARWQGEREGRDWTHGVKRRFLDEFQKRDIPGKLEQLDCRQTLCKMQIAFDSPNHAAKINAIEHDADTGWYADFRIEGEQVMVTAYLGAPGVDLRTITDDPSPR